MRGATGLGLGTFRFAMIKMMVVWVVVVAGIVDGSAAPTARPPPTQEHPHPSSTPAPEVPSDTRGFLSSVFPEGLKRSGPSSPDALESSASSFEPQEPAKALVKRSAENEEAYMSSIGYDPLTAWAKRNPSDPGFESYMQSLNYDPMMAWGKREMAKKNGYDSFMQSINYDPTRAWGKQDVESRQRSDTPADYSYGQDLVEASKNDGYADNYYPKHYYSTGMKKHDPYLDVYIPNHFMHSFKRSINPFFLSVASSDWKRAPNDMGAQGFHEGIFTHNFGDFSPVKRSKREVDSTDVPEKRRMGMGASGFHGDTFSQGFGDFSTMKKRMGASGFHGDTFSQGFGDFSTMKKRRLGMGASGFHGDTFNQGFGDFSTMKKRMGASGFYGDTFSQGFGDFSTMKKRMGASGFHGDTFSQGFGDFSTMKKRRMGMGASGFHGDTFDQGFGDFSTMKKRMGASGFHGDTFSQGFGDFSTMKKRRLGMGASGFHGDTFDQGFGDFSTMKKRMGASGFHGDTFSQGFGDFSTMKKRRMGMGASGFHGDIFSQGFGDFSTMKKRMGASGFHGDTFSQGFGDFSTMKKRPDEKPAEEYLAEFEQEIQDAGPEEKEKTEQVVKEKETMRKKRETENLEDETENAKDSDLEYGSSLDLAELGALHQQQEMNGRNKRNLEESGMLQVDLRPPVESDLSQRRRREAQDDEANVEEDSVRPLYKRSVEWHDDQMLSGGLQDFDTMKRRR